MNQNFINKPQYIKTFFKISIVTKDALTDYVILQKFLLLLSYETSSICIIKTLKQIE